MSLVSSTILPSNTTQTKAVVDMIQKHFTEENWEQCLTVISNTLALYHDKREQVLVDHPFSRPSPRFLLSLSHHSYKIFF